LNLEFNHKNINKEVHL